MTKDEALRLALEALEKISMGGDPRWADQAITAIKETLAQPEPNYKKALEVWLDKTEWVQETVKPHELGMHRADVLKQRIEATLAQPEQEPVAWMNQNGVVRKVGYEWGPNNTLTSLYTTPPQRKPLTEDEIVLISADCAATHQHTDIHFARAIEARLKEKNT
jgi:hypothetical protein